MSDTQGRAYKAGQQIGTGIKNAAKLAVVGVTALAGFFLFAAKQGQSAANVQKVYAQAITNSGKVSQNYVAILNAQQEALLNLAGVDDELIKTEQTRLIQMGLTGAQVAKLTPLILDVAKATGKDLLTVTLAVGKAAEGNNTALARLGIILPKNKDKTKAYADTVAVLNQRFGGTTQALSGSLDVRLAVLRERLANVRDEVGIKLLPVMTRIVDVVGQKLVPAFGQFINAILPTAIEQLNKLADFLQGGQAASGLTSILRTVKDLAPAIQRSAEITGRVISTAVGLFRSLPPEIQSLAVAGLAINKLTGGLVTNLAGGLISAVISSFKGLMNVNAAVVNVNGPVAGLPTGPGNATGDATAVVRNNLRDVLKLLPIVGTVSAIGAEAAQQVNAEKGTKFTFPTGFLDFPDLIGNLIEAVKTVQKGTDQVADNTAGPTDLSAATLEAMRGKMADALKTNRVFDAQMVRKVIEADRKARGIKDTGPSKTVAPRLAFLAGKHKDSQEVAVADALALGFERDKSPAFHGIGALKDSIKALQKDQKTVGRAAATAIGKDIASMKATLARRQKDAGDKAAAAARAAGILTAGAIRDKDLSVNLTNKTYFNGRVVDANLLRYRTTTGGSVVVSTGGGGA